MQHFRVWCPRADSIELLADNKVTVMECVGDGWYEAVGADAVPGTRYGYKINGAGPGSDPGSAYQPDGVHGLSELIDHSEFAWTDAKWQAPPLPSAVIYELHIGTFTPE